MSKFYRGLPIDASYQVSFDLAKQFQRKSFFRNRPIRNKHRLWRSCLSTDQNEMSNPHREPSIDASYQVSVHLAKEFQRRRFLEIDQSETRIAVVAMFVNGSKRNEQSLQGTLHRCFLPSFISFGHTVSEEKLFQKSTNQKQELPMATMFVNRSK